MSRLMRCLLLAAAIAAAGIGWSGPSRAGEAGYGPSWERWAWGSSCARPDWPISPECREYLARHDDARCLDYGPRGSRVYLQCRENRYYKHISLPLRAIK